MINLKVGKTVVKLPDFKMQLHQKSLNFNKFSHKSGNIGDVKQEPERFTSKSIEGNIVEVKA